MRLVILGFLLSIFSCKQSEIIPFYQKYTLSKISDNAVNLWLNQPSAIRYEGQFDRTYFGYSNSKGEVVIRYFDHESNDLSPEMVLHRFDSMDDHSSPALIILNTGPNKGIICVSFSHHSSPLYFIKSEKPEDLTSFSELEIINKRPSTYPSFIPNGSGGLTIFFRGHPNVNASEKGILQSITSNSSLDLWTDPKGIIEFNSKDYIYQSRVFYRKNRILISWSVFNQTSQKFKDVYYTLSEDYGTTWLGDTGYFEKLTPDNSIKVFEEENVRVFDIIPYQNQVLISANVYDEEYNCCGLNSIGLILNQAGETRFQIDVSNDYYAFGAMFDNPENASFYYLERDEKVSKLVKVDLSSKVEKRSVILQESNLIIRPIPEKSFSSNSGLTVLKVQNYDSYRSFGTELYYLKAEKKY